MNFTVVRAIATGTLLMGLGMLMVGCAPDKPETPESTSTILGHSDIGRSESDDGKNWNQLKDPAINADTRFAAGQLAESRGQRADALAQYREALKLNPKHQPTLFRMAIVETEMHQYPQAIQTWKNYVAATNESAAAWGNLGFCYQVAGKPSDAEAAYRRGIARDPNEQTCRINYGLMLVAQSRVPEAMEQFQAVLSPAESHYNVGSVYEQLGRKEQAKVEYHTALALDPNFADAQKRLDALK
ncbi:MAG: tetratricopeptide repeat protein [Phycisphaerae bacterium]|nr:tetratricopeptide repeat protein [Phycisphaerae bacterium]